MADTQSHDGSAEGAGKALTIPQALDLLREGEMDVQGLIPWSSNYTFLARVTSADLEALVVYKPRRGERPLWDFPAGTLYRRETAAFLISNSLGWSIVPPTVTRDGEQGIGMVQLFIEHDPDEHFFTFRDPWSETLTRIALFDVLVNNADRKGGHCLRDSDGNIWAIDHGICFHHEPKLRTVIWEPAGQEIPSHLLEDLRALQAKLQDGCDLLIQLMSLLSEQEINALLRRLNRLIRTGAFPLPPPGRRAVPWPMI
jgi:hypothetical protein